MDETVKVLDQRILARALLDCESSVQILSGPSCLMASIVLFACVRSTVQNQLVWNAPSTDQGVALHLSSPVTTKVLFRIVHWLVCLSTCNVDP